MIIKRIGPMSIARLSGMLYAVMGLVFGGIISLIALAGGFASDTEGATHSVASLAWPLFLCCRFATVCWDSSRRSSPRGSTTSRQGSLAASRLISPDSLPDARRYGS